MTHPFADRTCELIREGEHRAPILNGSEPRLLLRLSVLDAPHPIEREPLWGRVWWWRKLRWIDMDTCPFRRTLPYEPRYPQSVSRRCKTAAFLPLNQAGIDPISVFVEPRRARQPLFLFGTLLSSQVMPHRAA
jgi:hypothetical protein